MRSYIGIDLGTSSVKCLLINEHGMEKSVSRDYPLSFPAPGFSEQAPADWYSQTLGALKELLCGADRSSVRAISFSGQMHGLVLLDKNDEVIRPAILWNDGRSVKEVAYLNNEVGRDFLIQNTGNIAFAGFTAPKLLWVKNNEPDNFGRISKVMLPKDYLAYKLSGTFATDVSDAAGTLYFDTARRRWSEPMLDLIGLDDSMLPSVYESSQSVGVLLPELSEELGLPGGVKIVIGGGDNACAAVGTGTLSKGDCNISVGTSGTVFVVSDEFASLGGGAIHSFCSANGKYHYLACILSAASCQKWWIENILRTDYSEASGLSKETVLKNRVVFMPYLTGERSPINAPEAKAAFIGMTPDTTREDMTCAVLEGVAFALRHNIDLIRAAGVPVTRSKICGGGAANRLWLDLIAGALDVELEVSPDEQGAALGAALLAAAGDMSGDEWSVFSSVFYKPGRIISPDPELKNALNEKYRIYSRLPVLS